MTIHSGAATAGHFHPNCNEALSPLDGRLRHSLAGEVTVLEPGDPLHIHGGVPHAAGVSHCRHLAYDTAEREVAFVADRRAE